MFEGGACTLSNHSGPEPRPKKARLRGLGGDFPHRGRAALSALQPDVFGAAPLAGYLIGRVILVFTPLERIVWGGGFKHFWGVFLV